MKRLFHFGMWALCLLLVTLGIILELPIRQAAAHSTSSRLHQQSAYATTIFVRANQEWPGVDTGIDVANDGGLTMYASGVAAYGDGDPSSCSTTQYTTPDGSRVTTNETICPRRQMDDRAILPTVPVGTLIARVGGSPWFAVGYGVNNTIHSGGTLSLMYNDVPGHFCDNSGSYQVKVVV